MVADGLSNKQIGARLFRSDRTVAGHVRSILNKHGLTGALISPPGWRRRIRSAAVDAVRCGGHHLQGRGQGLGPHIFTVCGAIVATTSGPASANPCIPLPGWPTLWAGGCWPASAGDCDDCDDCETCGWPFPLSVRDCVWVVVPRVIDGRDGVNEMVKDTIA